MISVVKNGKEKTYYAKCIKCGSEMEYMHSDVKYETSMTQANSNRYIVCPICGETISVNLLTKEDIEKNKPLFSYGLNSYCC